VSGAGGVQDAETPAVAALRYAAAGIPVFPCVPLGKAPLTHEGFKEATVDPGQIRRWWRWQPEANIGLPTGARRGGVDVLDIDVHPGGDGYGALAQLEQAGLIDSWLQIVRSPSGGVHIYFPASDVPEQRSWAVPNAHVDFLADGSYVIAPPSRVRTRDGAVRAYEVVGSGTNPAPVKGWLLKDVLRPPRPLSTLGSAGTAPAAASAGGGGGPTRWDADRLADWVATQPEGNRNRGLFWAACRLAETGSASSHAWETLVDAGVRAGLDEQAAVRTVESAQRTAPPPGTAAPTRVADTGRIVL
jgi:hypothetical protein